MEPRFAELLPEVLLGIDPAGLAALAARALAPKTDVPEGVSLAHLHAPTVTVREQALVDRGPAAPPTQYDVPRAGRGFAGHGDDGVPVPGVAGAVPRGGGQRSTR